MQVGALQFSIKKLACFYWLPLVFDFFWFSGSGLSVTTIMNVWMNMDHVFVYRMMWRELPYAGNGGFDLRRPSEPADATKSINQSIMGRAPLSDLQLTITRRMAIANGTCVSFCNQPKAHFGLLWVRPWDNRGKCYMDGKIIQCWSNA